MTYRVIQWGTGNVGQWGVRGCITHPDLELAALVVNSPEKEGKDAGEFCDLPATGVISTRDQDAVLAMDADCVVFMGTDIGRTEACIDDFRRILVSGKNVVTCALPQLIWPDALGPEVRTSIEEACAAGNSSFFASGIEPGFMGDVLALTVSSLAGEVSLIRGREFQPDLAEYNDPELMPAWGFMKTPEQDAIDYQPGMMAQYFGPELRVLAHSVGLELDEIREVREVTTSDFAFDVSFGRIERGMIAGVRAELQGIVDGEVRLVNEHFSVLHPDVAPDWPKGTGIGGYEVFIDALPQIKVSVEVGMAGENCLVMSCAATAWRCLNAVGPVCEAPPGMKLHADLPPLAARMGR
jgi:hypothetical protein